MEGVDTRFCWEKKYNRNSSHWTWLTNVSIRNVFEFKFAIWTGDSLKIEIFTLSGFSTRKNSLDTTVHRNCASNKLKRISFFKCIFNSNCTLSMLNMFASRADYSHTLPCCSPFSCWFWKNVCSKENFALIWKMYKYDSEFSNVICPQELAVRGCVLLVCCVRVFWRLTMCVPYNVCLYHMYTMYKCKVLSRAPCMYINVHFIDIDIIMPFRFCLLLLLLLCEQFFLSFLLSFSFTFFIHALHI